MKRKLTWLAGWLCAALALGLAFWLRPDGEKRVVTAAEGNEPQVTKPYPRERDGRESRTKNPREEFEAARKRGLTEEEVRGIVEEFVSLGITFENHQDRTEDEYFEMGEKLRGWYRDALLEGFSLTEVQELVLIKMLREVGKKDAASFSERLARFRNLSKKMEAGELGLEAYGFGLELGEGLAGSFGLWEENVFPQNLIELDERQKEMIGLRIEGEEWILPRPGSATVDFGTKEKYENLDDPFTHQNGFITPSGKIFPLSMEQVDRIWGASSFYSEQLGITVTGRRGLLTYAKLLTAPQLMTLLLLRPDMAGTLMKELGD